MVKKGETLWKIAVQYYGDGALRIFEANKDTLLRGRERSCSRCSWRPAASPRRTGGIGHQDGGALAAVRTTP
jgi:nucleoid-associated protein YgaU